MRTLEEIKQIIKEHKPELQEKYHVKEIGIFGSYVRGEQDLNSDVDILFDYEGWIGYFELIQLEDYLAQLLKLKVDLVSKGALKRFIGERILKEVVMV